MRSLPSLRAIVSPLLVASALSVTFVVATTQSASATSVPAINWVAPIVNGSMNVTAGPNGTSYAFGAITSNTTFGSTSVTIAGTNDVVLVKRLANGNVDWVLQVQESTNAVGASSVVLDANNNAYIRGSLGAVTATFGSISVTGSATGTSYLAKVNSSGVVQWVKLMSSSTHLETFWTTIDPSSGDIYVSGRHRGVTSGTVTIASPGSHIDAFVMKFDSSGNALWGKSWGGAGTDMAMRVHVQSSSHIIVSGTIQSSSVAGAVTVAFDSVASLTPAGTSRSDGTVAKMNTSDGSFVWANMVTGTGDEEVLGIKTDPAGNVYVTGWFSSASLAAGSTTLSNFGTNDVWVAKLNSSGQFQWARSGGGSDVDAAFTLEIDGADNVYIAGYFGAYGSTTKNGVFGTTTLVSGGATLGLGDGFIASYSSSGTFRWALSTETAAGHGFVGTLSLSDNGDLFASAGSISGNLVVGTTTTTYGGTSGATIISFANVGSAPSTTTTTTTSTTTTSTTSTTTTVPSGGSTTLAPSTTVGSSGNNSGSNNSGNSGSTTSTTTPSGLVVNSATSTTSSTSTTTTVAPNAPDVSLGAAGVVIGGKTAATTVTRADNTILVSGGGIEATIYGESSDGQRIDLDENGDLRLTISDKIVVEAEGFESASEVDVWMYSTPTRLGALEVSESGTGVSSFTLPASVDEGEHRVVLDGANDNGQDVILGLGIAVGALEGNSVNKVLIIAPLTLAILFALLLPSVLRRRRKEVTA